MNRSHSQLTKVLDDLDRLAHSCASGAMAFADFLEEYGYPVGLHALDGHASSAKERDLLSAFSDRIALHIQIQNEVLHRLCSATDSAKIEYIEAGRISPAEAYEVLKGVVGKHDV